MNELDVLEAWHPADARTTTDAERSAFVALERAMEGRSPSVGRRVAGRALIAAAVTVTLVVGGVAVARQVVDNGIDSVDRVRVGGGALDVPPPGAPMNLLLVGTDSCAFVDSDSEADAFGTAAGAGGQRSDTMILVHVEGDQVDAVWLPRDLLVPDPAGGSMQLNGYANDGPEALIGAVRTLTGEPVDHYVEVDFPGFVDIVDDLGGVRMWVPEPTRDNYSGLNLAGAGCTTFDGTTALAWSRSRHVEVLRAGTWMDANDEADLDRIRQQQALLRAIGAQTRERVGTDVGRATRVLDTVVGSLKVDEAMDHETIRSLARFLTGSAEFSASTAPVEADPDQPGRLRLSSRPPGEDFFAWAAPGAQPVPETAGPGSPATGDSC